MADNAFKILEDSIANIELLEGPTGATGSIGIQGSDGANGANGIQGIQGIQGVQGDTGPQGAAGSGGSLVDIEVVTNTEIDVNGAFVQSLATISVDSFTGVISETVFETIEADVIGVTGAAGPQGAQGANGIDGGGSEAWTRLAEGDYTASGGTAWDLTDASFIGDFSTSDFSAGIYISPDGLNLFNCAPTGVFIKQYKMSIAWDVTTCVLYKSLDISAATSLLHDVFLSINGLFMYCCTAVTPSHHIDQYTLSVAFDLNSVVTYDGILDTSGQDRVLGCYVTDDGSKLFAPGYDDSTVIRYDLSTPFDITTGVFVNQISTSPTIVNVSGFSFRDSGETLYLSGGATKQLQQWDMSTPYDVTTATWTSNISVSAQEPVNCKGAFIDQSGRRLFISGNSMNFSQFSMGAVSAATYDTSVGENYIVGQSQVYHNVLPSAPAAESVINFVRNSEDNTPVLLTLGSDTFRGGATELNLDKNEAEYKMIYNAPLGVWEEYFEAVADNISGEIETPVARTYNLILNSPTSGNITSVTTISESGTGTAVVNINGTPLGGSSNSVSTSKDTVLHSTSNSFVSGDTISITVSSLSSLSFMSYTIIMGS